MKKSSLIYIVMALCWAVNIEAKDVRFSCPVTVDVKQELNFKSDKYVGIVANSTNGSHAFQRIYIGEKLANSNGVSELSHNLSFLLDDSASEVVVGDVHKYKYEVNYSDEPTYIFCTYRESSVYLSYTIPKYFKACWIESEEKNGNSKDLGVICSEK